MDAPDDYLQMSGQCEQTVHMVFRDASHWNNSRLCK